ncbi:hypothetical protein CLAVI_000128 [Candidatus Clavichlamydia salmonicola]|uniref:hypothetical protein n=1 Tax=Candidatus Clavichlamydia salmonicola TaxID=469812 RepID=UPI001891702F|nr:hypothetical protein [Candidatus Clavichlamydia salmonicola]MBF5050522.1 hypothetical protein [Candidatus Clavichlamydia salmonicola]
MSIFFWYPVIFKHHGYKPSCLWQHALNAVDQYFHIHKNFIFLVDESIDSNKKTSLHQGVLVKSAPSSKIFTACKIFTYLTIIIPLIMLFAKFLLRYSHTFKERSIFFDSINKCSSLPNLINPFSKDISSILETHFFSSITDPNQLDLENVIKELYELKEDINQKKTHPNIYYYYPVSLPHIHFELKSFPGIIFKTYSSNNGPISDCSSEAYVNDFNQTSKKYLKIKIIEQKLKKQNFDKLILPKNKLFTIKHAGREYIYLAEEKITCAPSIYANKIWQYYDEELQAAFIQLAKFITINGLEDISPSNFRAVRCCENQWKLAILNSNCLVFSILPTDYYFNQAYPNGIIELINSLYSRKSIIAVTNIFSSAIQATLQETVLLRIQKLQELSF